MDASRFVVSLRLEAALCSASSKPGHCAVQRIAQHAISMRNPSQASLHSHRLTSAEQKGSVQVSYTRGPAYFTSSYCMFRFACCASILHLMSVNWIPSCTHRCATESEARKMHVEMQHSKHEKANKRQSLCAKRAHALTRLGSSRQKSMLGTASTPRGTPARYTPRSAVHKRIGYTHQPLNIN